MKYLRISTFYVCVSWYVESSKHFYLSMAHKIKPNNKIKCFLKLNFCVRAFVFCFFFSSRWAPLFSSFSCLFVAHRRLFDFFMSIRCIYVDTKCISVLAVRSTCGKSGAIQLDLSVNGKYILNINFMIIWHYYGDSVCASHAIRLRLWSLLFILMQFSWSEHKMNFFL